MTIAQRVREDFSLLAILLIPIAIAVNFVGGSLALALKLPLFLDSIGTFLVAMLAGPLVGALTGFLSLAVVSATDPTSLPWTVQATIVGAVVGVLARRGGFDRLWRIIVSTLLVIALSVSLVVLIRLLVFGGFNATGSAFIAAALVAAGVPMLPAQFASSFVAELPDKVLSVTLALLVIRSMSDRYLIRFGNGHRFTAGARRRRRGAIEEQEAPVLALRGATGGSYGTYDRWRGTRSRERPDIGADAGTHAGTDADAAAEAAR